MLNESQLPDGYMENAQGYLIPVSQVRPVDIARDELVKEKIEKIKALQAEMRTVKASLLCTAFRRAVRRQTWRRQGQRAAPFL